MSAYNTARVDKLPRAATLTGMAKGKLKKLFRRAVSVLFTVTMAGLVLGYLALRTSLPTIDGEIVLAGLDAEIEILREANGVPHIYAETEADAYFGLGFVHAQDRLFQIEMRRRLGAGRMSEILGRRSVDIDHFFRTLGIYRAAKRGFAALDGRTQAAYEAYAKGVNAYLENRGGLLPPEFLILRAPPPEPWTPADSLVVLKLMAWDLAGNWRDELLRARLASRLSPEQIIALWPPYPGDGPVALPQLRFLDFENVGALDGLGLDELWRRTPDGPTADVGSNNWVVSGDRSESGKPLLANDPHLGLGAPGPFYLAHLVAPGLDVVGATLPGAPGVVLGHNQRIAWGFTNTRPDTQDLYIETLDPNDPTRYLAPDGSRAFETRSETIAVKGEAGVEVVLRVSRHGPVLSDLQALDSRTDAPSEVMALAWTALRDDDKTPQAGLALSRARDWPDFVAALEDFHGPQQNMVYADRDGNIGFIAPALVPIRRRGDGWLPAPGSSGDYDWDGFVPFKDLPRAFNPPAGYIVTANNKIVSDDYPYFITRDWTPPYRADRITDLLEGRKHDVESFRAIQADQLSLMARQMLPYLLAAEPDSDAALAVQSQLRDWDGVMDRERFEPLVFAAWYRELTTLVYGDELGPLFSAAWGQRPLFMGAVLEGRAGDWCDDIATDEEETCTGRSTLALERAVAGLSLIYGDSTSRWRWGDAHNAEHAHRIFQDWAPFSWWFDIAIENGGGRYTVNAAGFRFNQRKRPFAQNHGPAMRAIYDLAALDQSLFITSTGQSGNPLSPHYRDFVERWRDHRPFTIPTERTAVEAARRDRLVLVPR